MTFKLQHVLLTDAGVKRQHLGVCVNKSLHCVVCVHCPRVNEVLLFVVVGMAYGPCSILLNPAMLLGIVLQFSLK